MVSIVRRRKGSQTYYYLKHHVRKNGRQREIYLGKAIPDSIEKIKQEFLLDFYREEWLPILETIRQGYMKERKRMPKSAIEKEIEAFSIRFTYNTQRIEGSTLTLKDTALLLEEGIAPSNRPMRDVKEAEAHKKLFFEMLRDIEKARNDLSFQTVCEWHAKLFRETKPDIAGKIREHPVRIGVSKFVPPRPEVVRFLLKGFFEWYKKSTKKLNPVELAALVHLKFVTIHPFADGNGRITRLMMNHVLYKFGYPMMDINYNDRRSYYNALEKSNLRKDDVVFLRWLMNRYVKTNKRYIEVVQKSTRKMSAKMTS